MPIIENPNASNTPDESDEEQQRGMRVPGRDFAGAPSFASNQREQTADHRGDSRAHMMDDVVADADDEATGRPPRDES